MRLSGLQLVASLVVVGTLLTGCSGKLSRRAARNQIMATLKPHPVGPNKIMTPGFVPGLMLPQSDFIEPPYVVLDQHKGYGDVNAIARSLHHSPSADDYLREALLRMGYIAVKDEGPTTESFQGFPLHYPKSRTVTLTARAGTIKSTTSYSRMYSSGFNCYPAPDFHQCSTPLLIDPDQENFKITGITQDAVHASVNVLIPWKLTDFGRELKTYAIEFKKREDGLGIDSDLVQYPELYAWMTSLANHPDAGASPATVLFQKFDDGWRIVDQSGKSEKDYTGSK